MSESYIFDFSIPKNFLRFLNIYYNISDMNGAVDKFEFVLASYSQDNIEDCLTDKNMLGDGVTIHSTVEGGLINVNVWEDPNYPFKQHIELWAEMGIASKHPTAMLKQTGV